MNPEELLESIEQFVAESRALLEQGAMMELAGLENRVMLLCEEVLMLSQEDRVRYADRLQKLMTNLTALGEELTAQRDGVAEHLRDLPSHKKAHAAYKVVDKKEEKEEE